MGTILLRDPATLDTAQCLVEMHAPNEVVRASFRHGQAIVGVLNEESAFRFTRRPWLMQRYREVPGLTPEQAPGPVPPDDVASLPGWIEAVASRLPPKPKFSSVPRSATSAMPALALMHQPPAARERNLPRVSDDAVAVVLAVRSFAPATRQETCAGIQRAVEAVVAAGGAASHVVLVHMDPAHADAFDAWKPGWIAKARRVTLPEPASVYAAFIAGEKFPNPLYRWLLFAELGGTWDGPALVRARQYAQSFAASGEESPLVGIGVDLVPEVVLPPARISSALAYGDAPPAGWVLCRRDVYQRAGGFDPGFYGHLGTVDLAWRAGLLGARSIAFSLGPCAAPGAPILPPAAYTSERVYFASKWRTT